MEEEIQKAKRKYVKMFFEAQIITQELKKGNDNMDKQGHVYLYPESTLGQDNLTPYQTLTYLPYESSNAGGTTFKAKLEANASDIQNYFSINPEGQLVLATLVTTTIKVESKTDGDWFGNNSTNTTYQAMEVPIDYKSMISQYATPMSFYLELGMVTRNPEFLAAVVNLVKSKTNIQLTVLNTTTVETTTQVDESTQHVRSRVIIEDPTGTLAPRVEYTSSDKTTTTTTTTTIKTVTPTVKVTSVDTWICSQKITYSKIPGTPIEEEPYTIERESEEAKSLGSDTTKEESVSWTTRKDSVVQRTSTTDTYDSGIPSDYTDNTDAFVALLDVEYRIPNSKEKRTAGAYLKTDAELFFQLLSQSPETQGMELVMRYIMNKYASDLFPEVDLDFSMFDPREFQNILSGGTLSNYIKAWENLALWKYEVGESSVPPTKYITTKDGQQYYIVYEDGSAGHNNVAYGIATYISNKNNAKENHPKYGVGYYNWESDFLAYGVNVRTLATGDLVSKESAMAVFAKVVQGFETKVDTYLSNNGIQLEQTQRDALVVVCYQYGNIGNFAEAYRQCGNTDALKTAFKTASGAQPFNCSTDRKAANWQLFHTGKYTTKEGKEISAGIIGIADKIHKYMEQNNYSYCVYGSNRYEECGKLGKSHGLSVTFEASKTNKNTCCATYVSWVLQEAGYFTAADHTNGASSMSNKLRAKGWQVITKASELQPGDIVYFDYGHVEIYAGDGKVYNAGSGNAIRGSSPAKDSKIYSSEFTCGYRPQN